MKGEAVMKTHAKIVLLFLILGLMLPSAALCETRQGTISLEGMEEAIEETLYKNPQGFSFWYASERLKVSESEEGVKVSALYADDAMTLSLISEEDAEKYAKDGNGSIAEQSALGRVQKDVYRTPEKGKYRFLTLIAENGQYLRAVGQYSEEAAEGTGKFFDRVLDSVALLSECDVQFLQVVPGQWGEEYEGAGTVLTLGENGEMSLSCYSLDGSYAYTCAGEWSYQPMQNQSGEFTLHFASTDNPRYAESAYNVECVYAAYTESWIENDTLITYLLLNPMLRSTGVTPFEEVYGEEGAALHREQGPNMRVVNCKEFVSLRENRSTSSARLAKVPLGALVLAFPEAGEKNGFIACVYQDEEGYILSQYLEPIE